MKKIISMLGIAGALCLAPSCKKSEVKPIEPSAPSAHHQITQDSASLFVMLDSKPCSTPQNQYSSATIDIRGIRVLNSVHGWQNLTPVAGAWDVVSLQQAPVPVAEITEYSTVHAGTITKIALTFGNNNKLVVNDAAARCYNIGVKEVILDVQGEVKAGMLNQLVVSIDICGNISVQTAYDQDPCYTLNPVMAFHSLTQIENAK